MIKINRNCANLVVIDTRENPSAETGHFEKIWEKTL